MPARPNCRCCSIFSALCAEAFAQSIDRRIQKAHTDAIAVVDHLDIDRFLVLGASTGGAYALALAATSPRVIGAVACCAVSDMQWAEGKAMNVSCHAMWSVGSREEATAVAVGQFGEHGENLIPPLGPPAADPADATPFATPDFQSWWLRADRIRCAGAAGGDEDREETGG